MRNLIESERNEIRNLVTELREDLASLREDLSNANRRINVLESWRNIIREGVREFRERWSIREEQRRNEIRDFSSSVEGHLNHCDICMGEDITNYQNYNVCNNTWCLSCHSRINRCPFCRN